MRRPLTIWVILFLLLLLCVGGLYGGIAMLVDPSGRSLQLNELLPQLPVSDYHLPGLFLLVIMGTATLALIYGLLVCPRWKWAASVFPSKTYHWAWTGTLVLGVTLAAWLTVQGFLIGLRSPIQYVTAVDGFLMHPSPVDPRCAKLLFSAIMHWRVW